MPTISSIRPTSPRRARLGALTIGIMLAMACSGVAQMSPEEHASHHPGQEKEKAKGGQESKKGMAGGMGEMEKEKAKGQGGQESKKDEGGGMGDMMKEMGKPPPKELYPSLMALPQLSPEQRRQVEEQADGRMHAGTALMAQALDTLNAGTQSGDYAAMQEAMTRLREGAAQLESGIAARRALAEGKPPRQVALQWFKGEMNLQPPQGVEARGGLFGVTPFHLFTMVLLLAFALAMVAMYFFKMRRAAALFGRIENDSGPPPPGSAPPLAGASGPSAPVAPQAEKAQPPATPVNKSAAASPAAPPAADAKSPSASGSRKAAPSPGTV